MQGNKLVLRPTAVLQYEACPAAYKYQYVDGMREEATGSALPFGTSVHKACTGWAEAVELGTTSSFDPVAVFEAEWARLLAAETVKFGMLSEEDLTSIGRRLCESFPSAWAKTGLRALRAKDGTVLVEKRLKVAIDATTVLSGEPDIVAQTPAGEVVVVDLKTPAQKAFEGFAMVSDQLTAYQLELRAYSQAFGIPPVSKVAFLEGLKQKKNPSWHWQEAPARTSQQLADYLAKLKDTAERIRTGHFEKHPGSAFDSPCRICDFANFCLRGERQGLAFKDEQAKIATFAC